MYDEVWIRGTGFELTSPQLITDQTAMEPDVALAKDDILWVAWSERRRSGDCVLVRSYEQSQRRKTMECSARTGVEFQPTIVALPSGRVRVTWVAYRDDGWYLLYRDIVRDQMEAEQVLMANAEGLFRPRMASDQAGRCWIAYEQIENGRPRIMVSNYTLDGWSKPRAVTNADAACYRPSLSQGPENGMWLAYDSYRDSHYEVYLQRIDQPSEPLRVTNNEYQNLQPALARDEASNLWIAWSSNQNTAHKDPWWLTKWVYLRSFDGERFQDPIGLRPDVDVYNEDSFQGWQFPEVVVDSMQRIWIFGQSSHTLYAQYYEGAGWSRLITMAPKHWGSWKPRVRATGDENIYLASMGLKGAQLQRLALDSSPARVQVAVSSPVEPAEPTSPARERPRGRAQVDTPNGERYNVFFGDLHSHSTYSDGVNDVDEAYHRYRDAYSYDFAAVTDHDFLDGIELTLSELKMLWNHSERLTVPGKFVAFYGYEWTAPAIAEHALPGTSVGEGHRHILYPEPNGPLLSYGEEESNTGHKLLQRLQGTEALVIPHHTSWSGTDWDAHDEHLQRLIEVCSTHGRFECPGNKPIGYRRDHIHLGKFVLDALERGLKLGFVGGSDSHGLRWHATELEGRKSHIPTGTRIGWKEDAHRTGMTAILAKELTREALYEALYDRRCYATSGVPILLDFRIEGELMGSEVAVTTTPRLTASVTGTAAIRSAEVIRSAHVFGGLQCQPGEGLSSLSFSLDDTMIIPGESHYYYLRVVQEDGNMAWSSPIWVHYKE